MTSPTYLQGCSCPSHPCPIHSNDELTVDHVLIQLYWLGGFILDHAKVEGAINLIKQQAAELETTHKEMGILKNNVMVFRDEKNLAIRRWSELGKEIERLQGVILGCAEFHQGYADKLKASDPERSARQKELADLLTTFAYKKPEENFKEMGD